jgi:GNAT superfamily N-acetyltransferase
MIQVKEIRAEETYPIRKEELRRNVSLSHEMQGDHDPETLHLGLFLEDELVCIGSFMKSAIDDSSELQYQLRGMATSAEHQGRGYGRTLLATAETLLRKRGAQALWCNARIVALDFYRKMGYVVTGPSFELPEIGTHYRMYKKLA